MGDCGCAAVVERLTKAGEWKRKDRKDWLPGMSGNERILGSQAIGLNCGLLGF